LNVVSFSSYLTLNNNYIEKVTEGHSNRYYAVSYSPYIVTMTVSLTVLRYSTSKNSVTLKTGLGCSRSFKTAPFNRSHTTSYWSAIVNIALSCTVLKLFDVE